MSIAGFGYRALRSFLHKHEEYEIPISVLELGVAVFGMTHFAQSVYELYERYKENFENLLVSTDVGELAAGAGETFIFFMLAISILARLAVIWRAGRLGIDFGGVFAGKSKALQDGIFDELSGLGPRDGYLGALISASAETRKSVLDHIARKSATQFSIRTYGEADTMWKTWEERYLSDWLLRFPAAIWRLPPDNPAAGEDTGYFSIAIPVTEDAWRKVRFGHLSTALCTIDQDAVDYYNSAREEPYSRPLFIVFYTLIYVPTGLKGDSARPMKILYSGVEHLSYLLSQFFPAPCDSDTCTMSVICESPNASLEAVLRTFGFAPVKTEFDLELEHTHIRKSVAGFHLFEIAYSEGAPIIGDPARAGRFLDLLCAIGKRAPPQQHARSEKERDADMAMVASLRDDSGFADV